jgi:hypothetical protein
MSFYIVVCVDMSKILNFDFGMCSISFFIGNLNNNNN